MSKVESAVPVREGETLAGKYVVEHVLGAGGMGVVVAAQHLQLHNRVALKLILPQALAQPGTVERLLREARAAARLRSEHVAKVLDVGQLESGLPFIVMEFLDGKNLAEVLKDRGPLSVPSAAAYIRQACEALAEAHGLGIIHRDLKPENLFLTRSPTGAPLIKVLDFGISKVTSTDAAPLTLTSGVLGSPLYMSPEQMRSSHDVDERADIWSLGAILYELLTGEPPFKAATFAELCVKVTSGARPPLDELCAYLPPSLVAVVGRCLDPNPAERFASALDLSSALEPFAPPPTTSGRRTGPHNTSLNPVPGTLPWKPPFESTQVAWADPPPQKPRPHAKGSPTAWIAAGVALVMTAGISGALYLSSRPKADAAAEPKPAIAAPPPTDWGAPAGDKKPEPSVSPVPAPAPAPSAQASATGPDAGVEPPPAVGKRAPGYVRPRPASGSKTDGTKVAPSGGDEDIPRLRY